MTTTLPDSIRHKFPLLGRATYTNSCSQGALSDEVRAAYERYLTDWDQIGAPWDLWISLSGEARSGFARLLNATTDEIAVTTSVSAGVSALLSGLGNRDGRNKIVMSDFEFPTIGQNIHAQELSGIKVEHVPASPENIIPLDRLAESIDEETSLVAITYVCYRNGSKTNVEEVVKLAHDAGALVLLDAYQAVGAVPIDVRQLDVDFVVGGNLKYLLGSAGLGFLYCRSDLLESITPVQTGWFADDDIFKMDITDYSPSRTASKFEAGTPPIPSIYAGVAGMDLIHEIGVEKTEKHVGSLTDRLIDELDRIGAKLVTPRDPTRRGPMIAVASTDETALVETLKEESILTSSRDGNLRLSWHCYNSMEDVDAVVAGLERHPALLAR